MAMQRTHQQADGQEQGEDQVEVADGAVRHLDAEEWRAFFDANARNRLGMSGEEFLRRLDAGEFDEIADDVVNHPGLMYMVMLSQGVR